MQQITDNSKVVPMYPQGVNIGQGVNVAMKVAA